MVLRTNKNFALLYGVMLGDGCLSLVYGRKKFIVIAGSLADDKPFFEKIICPIIKKMIHREIPIKMRPSNGALYLNFTSYKLFDFIANFGFPIGKKGINLSIPKIFYKKNLIKYVIRGFFATDGSVVLTDNNGTLYPRIEANGISKSLIKEISKFLNSQKIKCNFYESKRKKHAYPNHQQQYRLQINGRENLKKFIKIIGFSNPKQVERIRKYGCDEN